MRGVGACLEPSVLNASIGRGRWGGGRTSSSRCSRRDAFHGISTGGGEGERMLSGLCEWSTGVPAGEVPAVSPLRYARWREESCGEVGSAAGELGLLAVAERRAGKDVTIGPSLAWSPLRRRAPEAPGEGREPLRASGCGEGGVEKGWCWRPQASASLAMRCAFSSAACVDDRFREQHNRRHSCECATGGWQQPS
jgi:hypothetical protein